MARRRPGRKDGPDRGNGETVGNGADGTAGRIWRERVIGAGILLLLGGLGLGLFAAAIPSDSEFAGVPARLADGLRVHLLLATAILAGLLAVAGSRRTGAAILLAALAGLALLAWDYRRYSQPGPSGGGGAAVISVLWLNMANANATPPGQLAEALLDSGADIVALAEPRALLPVAERLAAAYPYRAGCAPGDPCSLLVLSRLPMADPVLRNRQIAAARLVSFTVDPAEGPPLQIVAVHMIKPWYLGLSRHEERILARTLQQAGTGPLVRDFNAAPWSRRMLQRQHRCGLRHPPVPLATWPPGLGAAGIPIDLVLTRGGAVVTGRRAWGAGLGSPPRGLLFGVGTEVGAEVDADRDTGGDTGGTGDPPG